MPVVKNKIFIYLVTRYLTYGLQFVLSLIIAVRLGPYYLGVYGVVMLVLSYFSQVNFGIPYSLNILLVHNKTDRDVQDRYTVNSFVLYSYLNIAVVLGAVFLASFGSTQWGEYDLGKYFVLIILIAVFNYYNTILSTVIRFRNQINTLSLVGSVPVVLNLIVVWFFVEERLVWALTAVNLLSCIITIMIGYYKDVFPKLCFFSIDFSLQKCITHKGLYLFLYNSCFYFILIAVRTIVSSNYTVEEFGYFTFSYTIANAVMLMLDSLNTIIFPKTIDMLSNQNNEEKIAIIEKLREGYITTSHMLVYLAMIFFPMLVLVFPKYQPALTSMNMIALAILMNTNSYGYNTLLIAMNKEKILSRISFISLIITIVIGVLLVVYFHIGYSFVIISMLIAYLLFSLIVTYEGNKFLRGKIDYIYTIKNFFPSRMLIPYILALFISIMRYESFIFIPFIFFLILNYRDMEFLKKIFMKMLKNPNIIDV